MPRRAGIAVVVCAVTLVAGFALKAQCLGGFDGRQYERLCYNDLQPLYSARSVNTKTFPYVDGEVRDGDLVEGAIEYPVLTGLFMWIGGLLVDDDRSYLVVSAVLLAPFGLAVAYLLARMTGSRALLWAAAPALILYAFHNWDLLVVAAAVAGFWMWTRGRDLWAAAMFGLGAASKLYPLLFLIPLALERVRAGERRRARQIIGAGVGVVIAANLPFAIANLSGWWTTYAFHSERGPNFDSIWNVGFPGLSSDPAALNLVTAGLLVALVLAVIVVSWLRAGDGRFPFAASCAAMLASFMLVNKVHSPQYTLWLLPMFALLSVHWGWWVAYSVVDLTVYVGVFRWFYEISYLGESIDRLSVAKSMMIGGVWLRALLLMALVVVFMRARSVARTTFRGQPV